MSEKQNPTKVITGPDTRWSYANVWEPRSINGGRPRYSVSLLIPKYDTATLEKINTAVLSAYREGTAKLSGTDGIVPPLDNLTLPLHDGDLERPDDENYRGCCFINAGSASAPGIIDAGRRRIYDRSEVYSGVYGRASVSFYAYSFDGKKGIACALNNLQKIRDGVPLGNHSSAEDDFADPDSDDELPFN